MLVAKRLSYGSGVLALACVLSSCHRGYSASPPAPTHVLSLHLGQENTLLTPDQRTKFGLQYGPPDGTLGVLLSSGTYTFFSAARSSSTCAGTPLVEGTYRLGGSLTAITAPYRCRAIIHAGGDPNGYTFDRDYSAGGPVLAVSNAGQSGVLHIYHGEWHGGTCRNTGVCFYASLGMAISNDGGSTFSKLGEIVQPNVPRSTSIKLGRNLDVGGGTLVLADQNGQYISGSRGANFANVYLYVFYADRDPTASTTAPCANNSCIALARARLTDVVTAAFTGNSAAFPTLFRKYYRGNFTEPATSADPDAANPSGHYTPIVHDAGNFPTVIYDTSVHQYLMAYTTGNNAIVMRRGDNLLTWSNPISTGGISNPGESILYTTLVGEGSNPLTGNGNPWLFYVRAPKWPAWAGAVVVNRQVHVSYQ
jgi:hypothetical protein